jgi:hypothetical protein
MLARPPPLFPPAPSFLFPPSCPARLFLPRRASPAALTTLKSCGPQPTVMTGPMRKMAQRDHLRAFASCPAIPFHFRSPLCSFAHPSIPPSSPTAARSCVGPKSRHPCHLPRDLLNRSTNQPRRPAASSSNKPRQHDARLPHGPWPLPLATAPSRPDFCDQLVWRCGSAVSAVRHSQWEKIPHRPCRRWGMALREGTGRSP